VAGWKATKVKPASLVDGELVMIDVVLAAVLLPHLSDDNDE